MTIKICTRCEKEKTIESFPIIRGHVQGVCRSCINKRARELYHRGKQSKPITVRMPRDVFEGLKNDADLEGVSISRMIYLALADYYDLN